MDETLISRTYKQKKTDFGSEISFFCTNNISIMIVNHFPQSGILQFEQRLVQLLF